MADKKKSSKNTSEAAPHTEIKTKKEKNGSTFENRSCSRDAVEQITVEPVTISSFVRDIAAGAEFYNCSAKKVAQDFLVMAKGQKSGLAIKDKWKLQRIAAELGIKTGSKVTVVVKASEVMIGVD